MLWQGLSLGGGDSGLAWVAPAHSGLSDGAHQYGSSVTGLARRRGEGVADRG